MGTVIAIDGPAAAGKGTLAKQIAAHFGFAHLDTGAIYRACALGLIRAGQDIDDEQAAAAMARDLDPALLTDPDLRTGATGAAASKVAAMPTVRAALLEFQHRFAAQDPGAVLDGRDVGTVVCPNADAKLFVTASDAARAHRRWLELTAKGEDVTEAQVLADLTARDERDRSRDTSPMKAADDADLLDTTNLDIEAAFARAIELISARLDR